MLERGGLPLRVALKAATSTDIPSSWIDDAVSEGVGEDLFRRGSREGLDALALTERTGRLSAVTGAVAEAVAARVMDHAGFSVFAQLIGFGAHGADLLLLTPAERALVLEVKGTLRRGSLPRMRGSRLEQMSAHWLDSANAPMVD